jgi:hypothetical protein
MVWIPGSNNGEWGLNMSRGALFPAAKGFNGPMGSSGYPLPVNLQLPAPTIDKPYIGRAFGRRFGMVYELTPGGVTTEAGWGFKNKAFGRRSRNRRRSGSKKQRCEGHTANGKRCRHKTNGQFCKHHLKQSRVSRRRSRRSRRSRRRVNRSKKKLITQF